MSLFDRCAECRRCCNVDRGDPPLEITLTSEERRQFGHLCIERDCRFLGDTGCVLGESKPFSCNLYPLSYKPREGLFYYDAECPLMPDYIAQLAKPQSEASQHLAQVDKRLRKLEQSEPGFLDRNFAVDTDYFELRRLPRPAGATTCPQLELLVQPPNGARAGFRTPRGYQTWTPDNLCVASDHNGITYYTPRWDALCPYIDVTEDMLEHASRPFVVYALPPEGPFGVAIKEKYGLVDTLSREFWSDPRRARKFAELEKLHRRFIHSETLVPGRHLRVDHVFMMGREHFARYGIDDQEVAGFVDYVRKRDVLILQVHSDDGELVLIDVSILLPERAQVYGSFCQWNRAFKNRSPGLYACLLACRWTARNGYRFYNLGPVGSYDYKSLFVTDFEPVYGLALTEPGHPLALDPTSPLHVDFAPAQWNQVYRTPPRQLRVANSRLR